MSDLRFPTDAGEQLAYETLCDRGFPAERVAAAIEAYTGDLWSDFFGPMIDEIEGVLGLHPREAR